MGDKNFKNRSKRLKMVTPGFSGLLNSNKYVKCINSKWRTQDGGQKFLKIVEFVLKR